MQNKLRSKVMGGFAGLMMAAAAVAHPGHAPTDAVAQVSAPFAGWDHFTAFAALTALLLGTLRLVVRHRTPAKRKVD